jgi:hypothetical protein
LAIVRDMIAIIAWQALRRARPATTRCSSSMAQTDEVKRNLERLQPVVEKYGY